MSGSHSDEELCAAAREFIAAEQYSDAVELLEPLAERGSVEAMTMLGTLLYLGAGVEPDGRRAAAMLLAAAAGGSGLAAHNLATMYGTGAPGLSPQPHLCGRYYRMARDLGATFADDSFYDGRS